MGKMQVFGLVVVALVMALSVQGLSDQEKQVDGALRAFYDAAKAEDVEKYYATQDKLYLDLLGEKESIKGYFAGVFDLTDLVSYEIVNPAFEVASDKALVFYDLKSQVKFKDSGEVRDIENSMVAFLWKYSDGWKVRYTILESLYQQKIDDAIFSTAAMDVVVEGSDSQTIQQEMVAQKLYTFDAKAYGGSTSSSGIVSGLPWRYIGIGVVLIFAVIVLLRFVGKKKSHS